MGRIIRPAKWAVKPPLGSRLNRSHPLANGLVYAVLFNEGGGPYSYDLVSNGRCIWQAISGGDPLTFTGKLGGSATNNISNSGRQRVFYTPTEAIDWDNQAFSMVYQQQDSRTDGYGGVFSVTGGGNPLLLNGTGTPGQMYLGSTLNDPFGEPGTTFIPPNFTALNTWGVTVGPNGLFLYLNGAQIFAGGSANGTVLYPYGSLKLQLGGSESQGIVGLVNAVYMYCWNQQISFSDYLSIYADPYQMIMPATRRLVISGQPQATLRELLLLGVGK